LKKNEIVKKLIPLMPNNRKHFWKKNVLNDDALELFTEQFGKHNDLIKRFVKKGKGQKIPKKYSPVTKICYHTTLLF